MERENKLVFQPFVSGLDLALFLCFMHILTGSFVRMNAQGWMGSLMKVFYCEHWMCLNERARTAVGQSRKQRHSE